MNIKRFFAIDARQAMRMVKEELGEEAVILSNKRVKGGIELMAAIDYDDTVFIETPPQAASKGFVQIADAPPPVPKFDEVLTRAQPSLDDDSFAKVSPRAGRFAPTFHDHKKEPSIDESAPSDPRRAAPPEPDLADMHNELKNMRGLLEGRLANLETQDFRSNNPVQFELQQRLAKLGLGATLAKDFVRDLPLDEDVEELWRRLLGKLAVNVPVSDDTILSHGGVIALVGPTGVGKTTTIAKLAARYSLRYGSRDVALISTDNFRVGAHEQIKAYARILGVPFRFANNAESLQTALDYFCDRRLVLIDTAGMSQRDLRLAQQLSVLAMNENRVQTYLVMSATSRLSGMDEVAKAFSHINLKGMVLTKTDESTTLGQALDVAIRHCLPMAYISDGQRVPEDLQPARSQDLVRRSVAIMEENARALDNEWTHVGLGEVCS